MVYQKSASLQIQEHTRPDFDVWYHLQTASSVASEANDGADNQVDHKQEHQDAEQMPFIFLCWQTD